MKIDQHPYGTLRTGQPAQLYTLANDHGVVVTLTNYGGTIVTLHTPDRHGQPGDIVLGHDALEGYLTASPFFGCLVGRFANRIAKARFVLDDVEYTLAQNNGPNHLHGGLVGFDKVLWEGAPFQNASGVSVVLRYLSQDGEEGYPGNLDVTVIYTLTGANELRIDYGATTDRATVLNLTNHTYFNLAGQGDILGHVMQIEAERFTPVDDTLIPTGELRSVQGTPLDFRQPTAIGARIGQDDEQLRLGGGYDHNFVVNGQAGQPRPAATVSEPGSGRTLTVHTTQPGIQFYSGNMMPDALPGKGGQVYTKRSGLCLETQHFPDTPNQPTFPSAVLRPGETYAETTVFTFGVS